MRKKFVLFLLFAAFLGFAQKKPVAQKVIQKPVLLKAPAKTQTISMEYAEDILYFNKTDIIPVIESQANVDRHPIYTQVINYLRSSPNEIAFKQKDSTQFKNIGERNLYKMILQLAPEMRQDGLVSVLDKKTKQSNPAKNKLQTISMEYTGETLYFSKEDLSAILTKRSQNDRVTIYNPMMAVLNTDKPVAFIYNDTAKLVSRAERDVHKLILQLAPNLLAEAKAADKVKKTGVFNKQVFVNACNNSKDKKLITEKKGRIILNCEQ